MPGPRGMDVICLSSLVLQVPLKEGESLGWLEKPPSAPAHLLQLHPSCWEREVGMGSGRSAVALGSPRGKRVLSQPLGSPPARGTRGPEGQCHLPSLLQAPSFGTSTRAWSLLGPGPSSVSSFALFLRGSHCAVLAGLEFVVLPTLNSDPSALCPAGSHGPAPPSSPCLSPASPSSLVSDVAAWGSPV